MGTHSFGDWLEGRLRTLGLKQEVLGDMLGVQQSTISRWKNGADLKAKHVQPLADALGVTPDELWRRAAGMPVDEGRQRPVRLRPAGQFSAGSGIPADGFDWEPRRPHPHPERCRYGTVAGDCLAPRYQPGDTIVIDPEAKPDVGRVVALLTGGEYHVKRVERRNGTLVLVDNHGNSLTVAADDERLIGVVIEIVGLE